MEPLINQATHIVSTGDFAVVIVKEIRDFLIVLATKAFFDVIILMKHFLILVI
jgi:hypothetical protein